MYIYSGYLFISYMKFQHNEVYTRLENLNNKKTEICHVSNSRRFYYCLLDIIQHNIVWKMKNSNKHLISSSLEINFCVEFSYWRWLRVWWLRLYEDILTENRLDVVWQCQYEHHQTHSQHHDNLTAVITNTIRIVMEK